MNRRLSLLAAVLTICGFSAACAASELFVAPARGGVAEPAPSVADSVVTLVATIPYTTLASIADQKLPASTSIGGNGHVACADIPRLNPGRLRMRRRCVLNMCTDVPDGVDQPSLATSRQCADYDWHAHVDKVGAAQLARDGDALRVSQGVHIAGQAGVGGALAGLLSLNGKDISIDGAPTIDLKATLDKSWCPVVSIEPIGAWVNSATVELIGRTCKGFGFGRLGSPQICVGPINLGVTDVLNHEFARHRDDLRKAAQDAIPCESVKAKLASQWRPYAVKIERENLPPLYLNISPYAAAFSGLVAEDDRLRIAVRVAAQAVLAADPVGTAALPLPPLDTLNANAGDLAINLKVLAPYELLKQQLRQALAGKDFEKDLVGGKVSVHIEDVDLYPSQDALAIGLKIDAKTLGGLASASGWVYVSGKPIVLPGGTQVRIEDVKFATVIDGVFWSSAQYVFQDQILKAIKAHSTFDLSKQIEKGANEIRQAIAKAELKGLRIKAGAPALVLDSLYVADANLIGVVKLTMPVDVEVTEAVVR